MFQKEEKKNLIYHLDKWISPPCLSTEQERETQGDIVCWQPPGEGKPVGAHPAFQAGCTTNKDTLPSILHVCGGGSCRQALFFLFFSFFFLFFSVLAAPWHMEFWARYQIPAKATLELQQYWILQATTLGQGSNLHPGAAEMLPIPLCHSGNSRHTFNWKAEDLRKPQGRNDHTSSLWLVGEHQCPPLSQWLKIQIPGLHSTSTWSDLLGWGQRLQLFFWFLVVLPF